MAQTSACWSHQSVSGSFPPSDTGEGHRGHRRCLLQSHRGDVWWGPRDLDGHSIPFCVQLETVSTKTLPALCPAQGLVVFRVIGFLRGLLGPPFPSWLGLTLRTQGPPRTGTHTRPSSVTSTGSGVGGTSVIPGEIISPWWVPLQNRDTVSRRGGSHSDGGWRDPGSRLLPVWPSLREGSSGRQARPMWTELLAGLAHQGAQDRGQHGDTSCQVPGCKPCP